MCGMSRQLEGDKDAAHHSPSTVTAPCVREHGGGDGTWEPWQGFLIYKSTLFAWSASLIPAHPEGEATGKSPRSLGSARAVPGGTSRQHLPLYLVFFTVKDPRVSPGLPGCMSTW